MIRLTSVLCKHRVKSTKLMSFPCERSVMFSLKKPHSQIAHNQQLLAVVTTPLSISKRTMGDGNPKISLENPVSDYKAHMNAMMENEELDDTTQKETYNAIAAEARKTVWKLLFDEPTDDNHKKSGELLAEHKMDACFYNPWDYNAWIVSVRDELLKRKMFDFWHNYIVKNSLGLCWAMDSDYFDDMDDSRPADFYRHAGANPPWDKNDGAVSQEATGAQSSNNDALPSSVTPATDKVTNNIPKAEDLKISLETPVNDYRKLVEQYLTENITNNDDEVEEIYKMISEAARKIIWSLLFDDPSPSSERQEKAAELLKEHKSDAGFYAPWNYNDWVIQLRDEVLKREMLDFWRDQMVKHSLGPCWAMDSDYYDDMDDPEPAKFYKHAGCIAPWLKEEAQNKENESKSK